MTEINKLSNIAKILKENLTGKDSIFICGELGISISKLNQYLKGDGSDKSEFERIIDFCKDYFIFKYKSMLSEIECEDSDSEAGIRHTED